MKILAFIASVLVIVSFTGCDDEYYGHHYDSGYYGGYRDYEHHPEPQHYDYEEDDGYY